MSVIIENIQVLGPVFAAIWILTILRVIFRPQRFLNSFLLICFLLVMAALFFVPVMLVINGIQMIRKESFSPAHVLSLLLGIVVGIGEIATVVYVLGLSEAIRVGKASVWVLLLVFTIFYFSFLVLSFVLYTVFIQIMPHRMNFNYVVIHGCGLVDGERPTKLLSNRIDAAIKIYEKCKRKPVIIPSGGRGSDEKISEAQAMKNYLLDHGIPEEHIALEDQSATTRENLINSKAIIDAQKGRKKTALVSSNYHIYRCLRLAREMGVTCTGIGADVALYYWPSALIREFMKSKQENPIRRDETFTVSGSL